MLWGLAPSSLSHTIGFLPRSKHYFQRRRMFDCFVIHTFAINDYRQAEWCPRKLTKKFVELHMKCIKVTVFTYFQTVAIYIAPNASFSVQNAPNSWASGAPPQTPSLQLTASLHRAYRELTALPRPPSWIWLGSKRVPTENFWPNPPFQNPGYGPDVVLSSRSWVWR